MRAILAGRRIVLMLTFFAGLALWAFSAADNALNYTEVSATVDHIEEVCRPVGEPIETATNARCVEAQHGAAGKWWHNQAVHVRYRSPADRQQHTGIILPVGGQSAVDADKLRAGDTWTILAHDDKPQDIKAK